MSTRTLLTGAALVAVLTPAAATAGGTALTDQPFLGRISGGAMVEYRLNKKPASQKVTIAGKPATVKSFVEDGRRIYRASISKAGLKAGRSYRVTIDAGSLDDSKGLYLHRSMNR